MRVTYRGKPFRCRISVTRVLLSHYVMFTCLNQKYYQQISMNYSWELYSWCLWLLSSSVMFRNQVRNICTPYSKVNKPQYPFWLNWISQSSDCSSFMRLGESPVLRRALVSQYSSQTLLFRETSDRFLDLFLDLFLKSLKSLISCIPESEDVSCWDCNANSTYASKNTAGHHVCWNAI